MGTIDATIYQRPEEILQQLIRFDTTNPPGNEAECIGYVAALLDSVGLHTETYAKEASRPNLVCRLPGRGEAPPLLLYGHVDVVTTAGQKWQHDPFGGEIIDGEVWGRGALDMKGELTMYLAALMRLKAEGFTPAGDIMFMAVSDEEQSGVFGAEFIVQEHPELFDGVRFALGEFGGFSMNFAGKRFYPIQVAEKQSCKMNLTIRGTSGHGASIVPGNAMEELGKVLQRISNTRLPVHITPVVSLMFSSISKHLSFPYHLILPRLLNPAWTDRLLGWLGSEGLLLLPMFHNTVNPTIVSGGEKNNVVPNEVTLHLDGRLLPGFMPADMIRELGALLEGLDVEIEVLSFQECPPDPDMSMFPLLVQVLKEMDPEGTPIPMLQPGVTDGRHLAKLGIQSYGFTPMKLKPGIGFFSSIHGVNERIPVSALTFGSEAVFRVLQAYPG